MISLVSKVHNIRNFSLFLRIRPKRSPRRSQSYYDNLSRNIAYALRHKPCECGLSMDERGFVPLENLLSYLNSNSRWRGVDKADIISVINNSAKKRFQLDDGQIRAFYGHSFKQKIQRNPVKPPDVLFHGTSHAAAESIMREGITPQARQYVHLSTDFDTAISVGKRRDTNPVVFQIDTRKAGRNGVDFYAGNQDVWLADKIPPSYIAVC